MGLYTVETRHTILGLASTQGRINRQRVLHLQMRQRSAHEGKKSEQSAQHLWCCRCSRVLNGGSEARIRSRVSVVSMSIVSVSGWWVSYKQRVEEYGRPARYSTSVWGIRVLVMSKKVAGR